MTPARDLRDSFQKSDERAVSLSQLLTINPLNRPKKAGTVTAGEYRMAKVIKLELKRKVKARPGPALSGTAEILIFNGVRVERLETKKRSRKGNVANSQPRKNAV